jgi:hypothetical protein
MWLRAHLRHANTEGELMATLYIFIRECLARRQLEADGFEDILGGQCSVLLVIFLATLLHFSISILCLSSLRGRPLTILSHGTDLNFSA